jgi:hypothetical protein
MTDLTAPTAPRENVLRGSLLAFLAIPAGIIVYALVGGFIGNSITFFLGFISAALPYVASFLYRFGSGGELKAGRVPVVIISIVGIVLGVLVGLVATAWSGFSAVTHVSGILSPAFRTTFARQFANGDLLIQLLVGLGLGIVGIVGLLRNNGVINQRVTQTMVNGNPTPEQVAAFQSATGEAPVAPLPPGTAPAGTPILGATTPTVTPPITSATPSPGILLNGKPLDEKPGKKK